MRRFNPDRLPVLTKSVYVSQQKWVEKNWKDTLKENSRDIEKLLSKVCVFDFWKSELDNKYEVAKILMPEIFMEANLSVHYACMGLYKQAHACLRAQLETVLRLVYFSTHSVEFGWWHGGKDEYFKKKDVWVDNYQYFRRIEEVKHFHAKCKDNGDSVNLFNDVGRLYGKLSAYVHSGKLSFQTTPDRFSPKYKKSNFNIWAKSFRDCQKCINAILILGFPKDFKNIRSLNNKKDILRVVEDSKYKRGFRVSLNLRFRGRI